ncbi:MAG: polyprenol monophosphomannose synthase [Bacteroidota bacterium]
MTAPPADDRAIVVIPTYNESENVRRVIDTVMALKQPFTVLIVDDGSPDGTADLVRQAQEEYPGRILIEEREGKLGLGTAYLHGFRIALERGFTYICEMDADLSHNPKDLPRLTAPAMAGTADVVIGSRYVNGVRVMNWPLSRLMLSYGAGMYTRAITRLPIWDVTAGFKCFHRRVLEAIPFERVKSNGYSFQIELNYRAWRRGFRLHEVPIVFTERTEGQSKMSQAIVREAARKVWELRLRALFGRL